jgi:hypothetical protein
MQNSSKVFPLLALLACLLFAAEARADTFVITGGSATSGNTSGGFFTITGDGFTLTGGFNFGPNSCLPCTAGQIANFGSFNNGDDVVDGFPATFGGTTYDHLYFPFSSVRFSSGIIVPNTTDKVFTVTVPFGFTATLQGCTDSHAVISGCSPGDTVFSNATFIGQGTATVQMSSTLVGGTRIYSFNSIHYNFGSTSTPEPATLVLLATGLTGVGAAARRWRSRAAANKSP